jgi:hypothetical protein
MLQEISAAFHKNCFHRRKNGDGNTIRFGKKVLVNAADISRLLPTSQICMLRFYDDVGIILTDEIFIYL